MKRLFHLVLAILFVCANGTAQSDHEPGYQAHDGFFLSMSLGPGWISINDDITDGPYNNMKMNGVGGIIDIKIGYALKENLIIHGDIISISTGQVDVELDGVDIGTIEGDNSVGKILFGAGVTNYFMPNNMFISGTAGIGTFTITTNDNTGSTERGFGVHLKAGKEWWVSSRWGLGLSACFNYTHVNNDAGDFRESLTGTSVGVSFNATFN